MKYMRSRHVSLELEEPKALEEELEDFSAEVQAAGHALKSLRNSKGWTVSELARKVGLDGHHIELMESGEQPIPVVVAKRFGEIFHTDHRFFL